VDSELEDKDSALNKPV